MATRRLPNGVVAISEPSTDGTSYWRAIGPDGAEVGVWLGRNHSHFAWVLGRKLLQGRFPTWIRELRLLDFRAAQ